MPVPGRTSNESSSNRHWQELTSQPKPHRKKLTSWQHQVFSGTATLEHVRCRETGFTEHHSSQHRVRHNAVHALHRLTPSRAQRCYFLIMLTRRPSVKVTVCGDSRRFFFSLSLQLVLCKSSFTTPNLVLFIIIYSYLISSTYICFFLQGTPLKRVTIITTIPNFTFPYTTCISLLVINSFSTVLSSQVVRQASFITCSFTSSFFLPYKSC